MAALETLEILIEADRSGLESQLKRAGNSIQQFVNSMNKQEVSWTQILSKNITPALIAGIASTFAIAITQALQFQNALQGASLSAKDSFANNSAQMTDAIYGMSSQTGESANDIASALGIVQSVFKDTATAQGILNVITQEASIRNMSAVDTAKMLIPLFQEWGINDAPTASQATAVLNESVKNGTISFGDLVNGLTSAGPALRQYTDLAHAAAQTELASNLPGMDAATALQGLSAVAGGVADPLAKINLLMGNMKTLVSQGGIADAFATIASKIQSAKGVAQELYQQVGFNADAITHFQQTSVTSLDAVTAQSDKLIASTHTLGQQVDENMTSTKQLAIAWQTFIAELQKFIVPVAFADMVAVLDTMTAAFQGLDSLVTDFKGTIKDVFSGGVLSGLENFGTAFMDNLSNMVTFGAFGQLQNLGKSIGQQNAQTPVQNGGGVNNVTNTTNITVNTNSNDPNSIAGKVSASQQLYNDSHK